MSNDSIGIVACGAAAMLLFRVTLRDAVVVLRLRRHGIYTRGVVVDNVRFHGSHGATWVPVITFVDQRGYRVEFSPPMRGSGMGLPTGREVPVVSALTGQRPSPVPQFKGTVFRPLRWPA
ncbi:hypothetical protein [Streptomyces sp. NPDC053427]|uniref:hypothetical protein n=1 Tax=Streptomyces sp. NPDC053427 TaxID=3365701 RepID=UPI0037D64129